MPGYTPFTIPEYPPTITAKYWESKKSLLAKTAGETGVGEALKNAEAAYKKVDWHTVNIREHFKGNHFKVGEWKSTLDLAIAEIRGDGLKFVRALEDANKVALQAVKKLKDSKAALPKDVKLAQAIADEAELLAAKLHWQVVVPVLIAEHNDSLKSFQDVVTNLKAQLKLAVASTIRAIQEMQQTPTPAVFAKKQTEARKITQVVGNIERYIAMGFEVSIPAGPAKQVFDELSDYANGKVTLAATATEEEVNKAIHTLIEFVTHARQLAD